MTDPGELIPVPFTPSHRVTISAITVVLVLLTISFFAGESNGSDLQNETATLPFVWRDIACVTLLSAMPLGWILSEIIIRRLGRLPSLVLGLNLSGAIWLAFIRVRDLDSLPTQLQTYGTIVRLSVSLVLTFGVTLCVRAVLREEGKIGATQSSDLNVWHAFFAAVAFLLISSTYFNARIHHDAEEVFELAEQSRIGEAFLLLNRTLALDFDSQHDGKLLRRERPELKASVEWLRSRVVSELGRESSIEEQAERARELAMLGEIQRASAVLLATGQSEDNPDVCGLLAIISENQGQWENALNLYLKCQALWQKWPPEQRKPDGIYAAIRGAAFCSRKLGKIPDAEAEWLRLLAFSPTAETHFLLAQFYEDIQETSKAQQHAVSAAELDPSRYQARSEALIKRMRQSHFGCLRLN